MPDSLFDRSLIAMVGALVGSSCCFATPTLTWGTNFVPQVNVGVAKQSVTSLFLKPVLRLRLELKSAEPGPRSLGSFRAWYPLALPHQQLYFPQNSGSTSQLPNSVLPSNSVPEHQRSLQLHSRDSKVCAGCLLGKCSFCKCVM